MYTAIKHLHVACVIISITGFFLRGLLMIADSPIRRQRWLQWAPHLNDAILLTAAIALAVLSAQYPLIEPWLTAKVFGLASYIILGSIALKAGRTRTVRVGAWLAALVVFGYVVSAALTRSPAGFLAWV